MPKSRDRNIITERRHGSVAARGNNAHGFVLPLTLWIIALMGLAVAAVNSWVSAAADNARALQLKVQDELVMSDFKNEFVYELGTRSMAHRGLEVGVDINAETDTPAFDFMAAPRETSAYISFDGRPYTLESNPDYVVQIYDGRGLLNLNTVSPPILQRFLSFFDVPDTLRNQLPDTLGDWIDDDDFTRLAGAEKTDYERQSRHPPSNTRLLTPLEAQNIMGWDRVPAIWEADLKAPLFTTCEVNGFNPNTAPENTLLAYIPGMTKENTAQVLASRAKEAFRSPRDFMGAAGVVVPNEAFFLNFIPGRCLIIDITNRTTNERTRFSLSILQSFRGQPWQVDYAFHIPTRYRQKIDGDSAAVTFPTPETVVAGRTRDDRTPGLR